MKPPEGTSGGNPTITLSGVTPLETPSSVAPRPGLTLNTDDNASKSWLRSFTRSSSAVDMSDLCVSPAGSVENLAADEQPRSGQGQAEVPSGSRMMNRRKSDSSLWKWSGMFQIGGQDANVDKIQELDENQATPIKFEAKPADLKSPLQTGPNGSLGLMKFARRMSARDLNALSPTGDL